MNKKRTNQMILLKELDFISCHIKMVLWGEIRVNAMSQLKNYLEGGILQKHTNVLNKSDF